jgi:AcrR family transcriptional regulator
MEKSDPKQRIMRTAADLFATRGYGLVGVREIAREADVNISMISYYFNGKMGILRAIIENFFENYFQLVQENFDPDLPPEEALRKMIEKIIGFMRENREEALVMFSQLHVDEPEIQELKVEKVKMLFIYIQRMIRHFGVDPDQSRQQVAIFGPALMSTLFSTFLFQPIARGVFKVEYDDKFYDEYVNLISEYVLNGINGVQQYIQESED